MLTVDNDAIDTQAVLLYILYSVFSCTAVV